MKKQRFDLSRSLYVVHFAAALTIAVGQDNLYYKCKDHNNQDTSNYGLRCDTGKVIIVDSAMVGATDKYTPDDQCPITNNTCLKEITIAADLCTWRNSCDISQNVQRVTELQLPCSLNGHTVANFININFSCILPVSSNFGDICHFEGNMFSESPIYISSYPNFPNAMGDLRNYKCSCQLTSKLLSVTVIVTIRALLVKLTGAATCSERLSIVDSDGHNKLTFCSPCNNARNVTEILLASNPVISFQRDADISPFNGKFILEIAVQTLPLVTGSVGSMKCDYAFSTVSSSADVSKANPSFVSTKTTDVILSHSNGFGGSTNDDRTSSGMTVRSSNMSTSPQKSILSSSNPASISQNDASFSSIATPPNDGERNDAHQAGSEQKSLSTGGIIGVVLGSIGLIVIVVIVVLCLLRKRKQLCEYSKGNTNFKVQQSATVILNMHTTNRIEFHEATDSELHTFGLATTLNKEPQIRGPENNSQSKDNPMLNYEEGAMVCDGTFRPGMTVANPQTRLNGRIVDDLTTERRSLNSEDGDVTLVENQLYIENEKPLQDVASNDFDVARPVVHVDDERKENASGLGRGYVQMNDRIADDLITERKSLNSEDGDVTLVENQLYIENEKPMPDVDSNDYDVARPVVHVDDGRKQNSSGLGRGYVQMKNSSVGHSYYNVAASTEGGIIQSPAEVSSEVETNNTSDVKTNNTSDETQGTNTIYKADSDVVLIDNTLYGSMLSF